MPSDSIWTYNTFPHFYSSNLTSPLMYLVKNNPQTCSCLFFCDCKTSWNCSYTGTINASRSWSSYLAQNKPSYSLGGRVTFWVNSNKDLSIKAGAAGSYCLGLHHPPLDEGFFPCVPRATKKQRHLVSASNLLSLNLFVPAERSRCWLVYWVSILCIFLPYCKEKIFLYDIIKTTGQYANVKKIINHLCQTPFLQS